MRSDAFLSRRPYIRHEICERVLAGERLKDICAGPGAPSYGAVYLWRRQDPAFGVELATALSVAFWRRRYPFDDAKAAEIVRRMGEGESLGSILRDPSMPGRRCVLNWRRTQGHFAEAVGLQMRRWKQHTQALNHPPRRDFDPATAETVLLRLARGARLGDLSAEGLPGSTVLRRWRKEQPDFDADLRLVLRHGPRVRSVLRARATASDVADRVREGGSLQSVGAEPGMPCGETLRTWSRRYGDFATEIREACDARDDALADEILGIAEGRARWRTSAGGWWPCGGAWTVAARAPRGGRARRCPTGCGGTP